MPLTFIHLSDIHFNRPSRGGGLDLDVNLRREVNADIQRLVGEHGPCDGLLVTGDIDDRYLEDRVASQA